MAKSRRAPTSKTILLADKFEPLEGWSKWSRGVLLRVFFLLEDRMRLDGDPPSPGACWERALRAARVEAFRVGSAFRMDKAEIAARLGISVRTVERVFKDLTDAEYVECPAAYLRQPAPRSLEELKERLR